MKAKYLQRGDTIGIISPSWGGAGLYPHRFTQGVNALQKLGFQVKVATHALHIQGHVSASAQHRADDLHAMFIDPDVRAILCAIGGDHSCQLLPYLDLDLIRSHPKIFMGYSDVTVLNMALWSACGLITFNGPSLLADFAEWPNPFDYTLGYFFRAINQLEPIGKISPSSTWTDEFLSWENQVDQTRARHLKQSTPWNWLKTGYAQGRLIGGCLASLQHLRGTPFWPNWEHAIFFFELSGEKPEIVDAILMDYQNMGVFGKISGLIVGRAYHYTEHEQQQLNNIISERTRQFTFPIITNMDFGHTAPQFTLPIGCQALIHSEEQIFSIIESAVEI